jgi:hypothetical protein
MIKTGKYSSNIEKSTQEIDKIFIDKTLES